MILFKALPVVREVSPEGALAPAAKSYARDTITLGWEERLRARARRRSDGGLEFGTALSRGTVLHGGDCFVVPELSTVVVVVEREEPVFVVQPSTSAEWALFAYHIGNSHQPMMIVDEGMVCPDVPGMEQTLQYHKIPFVRAIRTVTPVAVSGDAAHGHLP